MSRITDQVDRAGSDASAQPRVAPRAVVSTDAESADAAFAVLASGGTLQGAVRAPLTSGVRWVEVPVELHALGNTQDEPSEPTNEDAAGTLTGAYRGHPITVPNDAAGRTLLHALRLLEEDPLSDMSPAARGDLCAAALAYACREEARGTAFGERVTLEAVDTFLEADPGQLVSSDRAAPEPLESPLDALLVLDAAVGGVALSRTGTPLVLVRAGRPALLAVAAGTDSGSARALLAVVVGACDLRQPLAATLSPLGSTRPVVAMLLDERGAFDAAGSDPSGVHVRGYERLEAS